VEARWLVQRICDLLTEEFDTPVLVEARELLVELGLPGRNRVPDRVQVS